MHQTAIGQCARPGSQEDGREDILESADAMKYLKITALWSLLIGAILISGYLSCLEYRDLVEPKTMFPDQIIAWVGLVLMGCCTAGLIGFFAARIFALAGTRKLRIGSHGIGQFALQQTRKESGPVNRA